jgi:hypothetical protein
MMRWYGQQKRFLVNLLVRYELSTIWIFFKEYVWHSIRLKV